MCFQVKDLCILDVVSKTRAPVACVPIIFVAVQRDELADVLSDYFEQSEQLATRFWLSTRAGSSAGLMLQQLPKQLIKDEDERLDQWQTLCALADTPGVGAGC